jgi:hypothetical protein
MRTDRSEVTSWLVRAEQARRIAGMLVGQDADVAQAYARECETRARELIDRWHYAPMAA